MNTTEIKESTKLSSFSPSSTHVELIDSNGNSVVDEFNGQACEVSRETSSKITLSFSIPEDKSAAAFVYTLMLGGNIDVIQTHRVNADSEIVLTIKHEVQIVSDWSIENNKLNVSFVTESSVVINGDLSVEEDASGSSN